MKIKAFHSSFDLDYHVKCYVKIKIKVDAYKIIYVQYEKEIIVPSNDFNLIIAEDNLAFEMAYNYHGREVCAFN